MITKPRVSLDEFLAMEETKPYLELIDGEVVAKPMPNDAHATIVAELILQLGLYLRGTGEGRVKTELRHLNRASERVYLPDVEVQLGRAAPQSSIVERLPDLAIEVLSPDTHTGRAAEKVNFYLSSGVRLVWQLDPDTQTVTVYRPDRAPELFRRGQVIDAKPVLREFALDLDALFSVLDEPGEGDARA